MENVKEIVNEIKTNLSQTSSSTKDEVKVMKAMLNDKSFKVDVYGKEGVVDTYCPASDAREMCAGILTATAKIPAEEAANLMDKYEFKKSDAATMIGVGKEFVNSYLQTGRKLPLGGREKSNVSLSLKTVDATTRTYPKKIGIADDGTGCYENAPTEIKAHESVRVHAPCPSWVK